MASSPDPGLALEPWIEPVPVRRRDEFRRFLRTVGWLVGGPYRFQPGRLLLLNVIESIASVAAAVATILLVLFIRTIYTGAPLGPTGLSFENPRSPVVVGGVTAGLVAVAAGAAWTVYFIRRALAEASMAYARRLRELAVALLLSPSAAGWQAVSTERNPSAATTKVIVSRLRSATVAVADSLGAGPAVAVLCFSVGLMATIDALALLPVIAIAILFFLLAESVNRRVQELTISYDDRVPKTRERFEQRLETLANGGSDGAVSFARVDTDDRLFHERLLSIERLRAYSLLSSAVLLAALITYFTAFRSDEVEIASIVVYLFAARYAMAALQRVSRALVQVSRRLEDIRALHALLFDVEDVRTSKVNEPDAPLEGVNLNLPNGMVLGVDRKRPLLLLLNRPATEARVEAALTALDAANSMDASQGSLVSMARIAFSNDVVASTDVLSTAPVRAIVSEDPVAVAQERRHAVTFIIHHKPKLVLAQRVLKNEELFSGWLLIRDGDLAAGGTIEAAHEQRDLLRSLHRPHKATTPPREHSAR